MKKLFYMTMLLAIPSIFMALNNDNNKVALCAVLASVIPCAKPVLLIGAAWHEDDRRDLCETRKQLFLTSLKSATAGVICTTLNGHCLPNSPKLALFLAAHAVGIIPGILGMVFTSAKI